MIPFLVLGEAFPLDSVMIGVSAMSADVVLSNFMELSRFEAWIRGRLRGRGESVGSSRRAVDAERPTPLSPEDVKVWTEVSAITAEEMEGARGDGCGRVKGRVPERDSGADGVAEEAGEGEEGGDGLPVATTTEESMGAARLGTPSGAAPRYDYTKA